MFGYSMANLKAIIEGRLRRGPLRSVARGPQIA
jgi:hypothetical protein